MTRPHLDQRQAGPPRLHQQTGGPSRSDRPPTPAAAPGPSDRGSAGEDPRWPPTSAPEAPGPDPYVGPVWTATPWPGSAEPRYDGHTWYLDDVEPITAQTGPVLRELAASVHLRRAALDRMMRMNLLHARNAWEQRRSDPIAPHAVAWLFAQPDERPAYTGSSRLTAGWRLWVDGPDARDLPDRLFRYHTALVQQLSPAGVVDLRSLATGCDQQMAGDAVYVGLGISSLDTATGSWQQLLEAGRVTTLQTPAAIRKNVPPVLPVGSDIDVPGTVRILLADGTVIIAERRGMCELDQQVVWSTQNLSYPGHDQLHPWQRAGRDVLWADAVHGPVLEYMHPLHDLFTQLDHTRLTDHRSQPGATGRPRGIA